MNEPSPLWSSATRYCPQRGFPPYRFVPGLNPHPKAHPQGHSYGVPEEKPTYLPPERWKENFPYLFGFDLYHQGYFWESHEVWECLWHLTRKEEAEGQFLQGLIQNAAAQLKKHLEHEDAACRLSDEAIRRFEFVQARAPKIFMGVDISELLQSMRSDHETHSGSRSRVLVSSPLFRLHE